MTKSVIMTHAYLKKKKKKKQQYFRQLTSTYSIDDAKHCAAARPAARSKTLLIIGVDALPGRVRAHADARANTASKGGRRNTSPLVSVSRASL